MNETLKQIAIKAQVEHCISHVRLQEFADLIVKEMLQTCEDHPAWTGRMISEQIKKHFGVDE